MTTREAFYALLALAGFGFAVGAHIGGGLLLLFAAIYYWRFVCREEPRP